MLNKMAHIVTTLLRELKFHFSLGRFKCLLLSDQSTTSCILLRILSVLHNISYRCTLPSALTNFFPLFSSTYQTNAQIAMSLVQILRSSPSQFLQHLVFLIIYPFCADG